eukprot:12782989-Alexandrium_andersonii.AAC.1
MVASLETITEQVTPMGIVKGSWNHRAVMSAVHMVRCLLFADKLRNTKDVVETLSWACEICLPRLLAQS